MIKTKGMKKATATNLTVAARRVASNAVKKLPGFEHKSNETFFVVSNSKGQLCAYDENSGRYWLKNGPDNALDYAERLSYQEAQRILTDRTDNGFSFQIAPEELLAIHRVKSSFESEVLYFDTEEAERKAALAKLTDRERQLLQVDARQTSLFIVEVEEHDSFSGRKIDGYRAYAKADVAQDFVNDFYAKRRRAMKSDAKTPGSYVNYNILGWRKAGANTVQSALANPAGWTHLDNLKLLEF